MSPTARPRRAPRLLLCLVLVASPVSAVLGSEQRTAVAKPDETIAFDIPSQPLAKALHAFSAATGIEILVDARKAAGRRAAGVRGTMVPRDALQVLLAGTDVVAHDFAPGTVTLTTAVAAPQAANRPASGAGRRDPPYFAALQLAVLRALCRADVTLPGDYRAALALRIAPSGSVTLARLLDTTGTPERDDALAAAVRGLDIGERPPVDLPQPVVIIVAPRAAQDPVNCPAGAQMRRHATSR